MTAERGENKQTTTKEKHVIVQVGAEASANFFKFLPLSGIIFSRHILYECIQKSPFHLDCMGFKLILFAY